MRMRKAIRSIVVSALIICIAAVPVMATEQEVTKSETVYVKADRSGYVQKVIVNCTLHNESGSKKIEDYTTLSHIKNVKGKETFTQNEDGSIVWNARGKDISYQGISDSDVPVSVSARYFINGSEISGDKLDGPLTGRLKIMLTAKNDTDIPFTVISMVSFPRGKASNIEVSTGSSISSGGSNTAVGITFPGLIDSLDLSALGEDIQEGLPGDTVTITCDVDGFENLTVSNMVVNGILGGTDLTKTDDLSKAIKDLKKATSNLAKGSGKLSDALETAASNAEEFADGVEGYTDGVSAYAKGVAGVKDAVAKAAEESKNLGTLAPEVLEKNNTISTDIANVIEKAEDITAIPTDEEIEALEESVAEQTEALELLGEGEETEEIREKIRESMEKTEAAVVQLKEQRDKAAEEGATADLLTAVTQLNTDTEQLTGICSELAAAAATSSASSKAAESVVKKLSAQGTILTDNGKKLSQGAAGLVKGLDKLSGAMSKMSDGIKTFSNDGIGKNADSIEDLLCQIDTLAAKDASYTNFSGKKDGMDGDVRFVIMLGK